LKSDSNPVINSYIMPRHSQ